MCKKFAPSEFLCIAQQNRGLFFQFLCNFIQHYYYYGSTNIIISSIIKTYYTLFICIYLVGDSAKGLVFVWL